MSRGSRKAAPANAGAARCTVTICRGTAKTPALDHAARLDQLRSSIAQSAQVRITGCPGACEHANVIVIVIQPSAAGRRSRGRRCRLVWPGLVNGRDAADDIAAWVARAAPGQCAVPDVAPCRMAMTDPAESRPMPMTMAG
ncbi:(2Fe-2S) ferredoxin domain-containing protein [Streptomyces hygroscopicus]|uniref:(2Fe-2S) ferredoxin domain-containing protein n=1 Tax=Streptomyces hygroscopicus TaxID=1912 RepID=UPI00362E0908